jgi:leucyl-tRNA synthetase
MPQLRTPIWKLCILIASFKSEKIYQQKWAEEAVFRQDAPATVTANPPPRFYGTMAYPYMNGTLHAGHAFTASKIGL